MAVSPMWTNSDSTIVFFPQHLGACRRRTPRAFVDPKVPKGASRRDLSDAALRLGLAPRRSPSVCAEKLQIDLRHRGHRDVARGPDGEERVEQRRHELADPRHAVRGVGEQVERRGAGIEEPLARRIELLQDVLDEETIICDFRPPRLLCGLRRFRVFLQYLGACRRQTPRTRVDLRTPKRRVSPRRFRRCPPFRSRPRRSPSA